MDDAKTPEPHDPETSPSPDVEPPGREQPGASPSGAGEGIKPAPDDADEGKPPDDLSAAQIV